LLPAQLDLSVLTPAEKGHDVVGLDNMNSYYDPALKAHRLEHIAPKHNFKQVTMNLADRLGVTKLFKKGKV